MSNKAYGDEGFELQTTGVKIIKVPRFYQKLNLSNLLSKLARDESAIWHTLLVDFLLVAEKLNELGFTYCNGKVVVAGLPQGIRW
jgi:hypothetical protein